MTNQELQARVEAISMSAFHQPFNHQAVFNARLRTTGGRFYPATMNLDFNPKIFALYPSDVTDGIIKHLLAAVGGSRFAPPLPMSGRHYVYQCTRCGRQFVRRRRINVTRYACGVCRGKLRLQAT